jgi:glycosyltransferase involved in cell wall biosynthesis
MPSATSVRLLVIVPAWNEQETLPAVISELHACVPDADVLVVDDGSTDATAPVARAAGARVLPLPVNLGVGGAMRAGYRYALRHDYDRTVQLDADGQHDPADIPRLLAVMEAESADVVIGARFAGVGSYTARGPRRWSMRLLAAALSRVTRTKLTDSTSGYKACNRRAIRVFSANYPAEYLGDTVESLVIAARAGLRVRQVGVAMRPRAGGRPSHSPLRAAVFLIRAVFALLIAISRPTNSPPEAQRDAEVAG